MPNQNIEELLLVGESFCFIDLEGTLADNRHRLPLFEGKDYDGYELASVHDALNDDVYGLIWLMNTEVKIVVLSTRREKYRSLTEAWLTKKNIPASAILLRGEDNWAPEPELKERMIAQFFGNEPEAVQFVLDDSLAVCERLKEKGYNVWHRL